MTNGSSPNGADRSNVQERVLSSPFGTFRYTTHPYTAARTTERAVVRRRPVFWGQNGHGRRLPGRTSHLARGQAKGAPGAVRRLRGLGLTMWEVSGEGRWRILVQIQPHTNGKRWRPHRDQMRPVHSARVGRRPGVFGRSGKSGAGAFGASSARELKMQQAGQDTPGPGSYSQDGALGSARSCHAPSSAFRSSSAQRMKGAQEDTPGVGSYDPRMSAVEPSSNGAVSGLRGRSERFKAEQSTTDPAIGPGSHEPRHDARGNPVTVEGPPRRTARARAMGCGGRRARRSFRHGSRPALLRQSFLSSWPPLLICAVCPTWHQTTRGSRTGCERHQRLPERNRKA